MTDLTETVKLKNGRVCRLQPCEDVLVDPQTQQLRLIGSDGSCRMVMSIRELLDLYNTAVDLLYFSRFRCEEAEREAEYWRGAEEMYACRLCSEDDCPGPPLSRY